MASLASQIEQRLPAELLEATRRAGQVAAEHDQPLYLVGGVVRDLLLSQPSLDLDLVVEGDALELARSLAKTNEGEVLVHPRFGTAQLRYGSSKIDLATARRESYSRPGALPRVTPGSISDDLGRRDFTINAMAIHLSPVNYGKLLDPYNGRGDIESGLIRILHPGSFNDDATRILRAIRYEQRFGFRLERRTEELLRKDLPLLDTISGDRLRHELELILKEQHPEAILHRLGELGVLPQIHPSLPGNGWLAERFEQARQVSTPVHPSLYLSLLVYHLTEDESEAFIHRLRLPKATARTVRDTHRIKAKLDTLAEPGLSPSSTYRLLEDCSTQSILSNTLACGSILARQRLQLFLGQLRYVKLSLGGEDLKRLGVPSGPMMGQMRRRLLEARLDGKAKTREEEKGLVLQWLREAI
jgi:tRNA nucleotidyltransferase (CCA-adding enzyme)